MECPHLVLHGGTGQARRKTKVHVNTYIFSLYIFSSFMFSSYIYVFSVLHIQSIHTQLASNFTNKNSIAQKEAIKNSVLNEHILKVFDLRSH